jgi:hypothetical protein
MKRHVKYRALVLELDIEYLILQKQLAIESVIKQSTSPGEEQLFRKS